MGHLVGLMGLMAHNAILRAIRNLLFRNAIQLTKAWLPERHAVEATYSTD